MNKEVKVVIIVMVIIAVILLANSIWPITGNVASFESKAWRNYGCTDSDWESGGIKKSIYEKGTVTKSLTSGGTDVDNFVDECVSNARVKEYYCNVVARVSSKKYYCENGCVDGACVG